MFGENHHNFTPQEQVEAFIRFMREWPHKKEISIEVDIPDTPRRKRSMSVVKTEHNEQDKRQAADHKKNLNLEDRLLTGSEAAEFLRISRTTLWRLRKNCWQ